MIKGLSASPGSALGPVVLLDQAVQSSAHTGTSQAGSNPVGDLPQALVAARLQLEALRDSLDPDDPARGMLDFQIEFLGDPVLLEPAAAAHVPLAAHEEVWLSIIEAHIEDFEAAEDEYFRHRASDLRDIRDRVIGVLRQAISQSLPVLPDHAVVVADDLSPSRFIAAQWKSTQALVLRGSSPHAHVAMLARARALPMVVAVGAAEIAAGGQALVDGTQGTVQLDPDIHTLEVWSQEREQRARRQVLEAASLNRPATTACGERVTVMINLASLEEIENLDPSCCDGIGLVRTELLFAQGVPTEDEQLGFYRKLLSWAQGRPVVVRTLDAGGDKPVPGLGMLPETNPFLGLRGLRLCLRKPEVFRAQLRALLRAAGEGDLRIMLPMLTNVSELAEARAHLQACRQALSEFGSVIRMPPLGVMVEVPALALSLEELAPLDFASIGSNDLLQYTVAAARDEPSVSALADPQHRGFRRLMHILAADAASAAIPLSICGDLAGQPAHIPALLELGLRSLSVPVSAIGATKAAIAAWHSDSAPLPSFGTAFGRQHG